VDVQIRVEAHAGRAFFAAPTRQQGVRDNRRANKGAIRLRAESTPVDIKVRRPAACSVGAIAQDCATGWRAPAGSAPATN
jgi:hypothetical protein